MLGAYKEILRKRQVQVVVGASVVAGLTIGLPLAIVLMVEGETGSFGSAGAVTGAYAGAAALTGPIRGRLIDRYGQSRTLPPLAIGTMISLGGLVAGTLGGAPLGLLIVLAAVSGVTAVPLLPSMRTLWADLVDHPDQLDTAYSIQAIVLEVFFIAGPLAAGALIAVGSPAAAVLALGAAELVGVLAFAATPASRAWRGAARTVGRAGALASPGMRTLTLIDVPTGALFGLIEVGAAAFAESRGVEAAAGILLAALAAGSILGGIVYGARSQPAGSLGRRYVALLAGFAVLVLPLALADSIAQLALLMGLTGILVAPISTVAFGLIDQVAPAGTATEAMSWLTTSYTAGLAVGTVCAGALVEEAGTETAFLISFGLAVAAALIAYARRETLGNQRGTSAM